MANERKIEIVIAGDASGATKAFGEVEKKGSGLGSTFMKVGALAGGLFAAAGIGSLISGSLDAASEAMKVSAQTEAVIKSTGASAGVTADHVGTLAHSLQNLSGVSDETIQTGQNMLLTFTNIKNGVGEGNQIFDEATKTMLDMAVATGGDAKQAALQLGKALNDPIKGVSALGRVGVTFTAQQKAQIKAMAEAGDTAGAQKIILAELSKEFGGSAAAAGAAMTPMERFSMRIGDMQEAVGLWLIPKLEMLSAILMEKIVPFIATVVSKLQEWAPVILVIAGVITAVFLPAMIAAAAAAVASAATQVAAWVTTQASAIAAAVTHSAQVVAMVAKWIFLGASSLVAAAQVAAAWLISLGPIALVIAAVVGVVALIVKNWDTITKVTTALWDGVKRLTSAAWDAITGAIDRALGLLKSWFMNFTGPGLIIKHWETIKRVTGEIWNGITGTISGALDGIVGFVTGMPGRIASAASGMWDGITSAFKSAVNTIIRGWNRLEFRVPGFNVGPISFGGFTLGLPNIPYLAKGTNDFAGGLAIVGEEGPELVNLPRHSQVIPNGRLGGAGAAHIEVNIHVAKASDLTERQWYDIGLKARRIIGPLGLG